MSKPLKRIPGEEEEEDEEIEIEQPVLSADDPLRNYLPTSFGRQDVTRNLDELYEKVRRVPAKPPKPPKNQDSDSDSDGDDDDDEDDDEFPVSHAIELKSHARAVSSISLDPSGTRMATASHDCSMKLYDFPGMSMDHLHPFRSIEPTAGSHHVHSATFSQLDNGQNILVVPAATQAKVYTRDGHESVEFVKGDMYLRDMHNTKGHVAEITAGVWHPTNSNLCATASADSTIRIWDINSKRQHKDIMVHKSRAKGGRSRMCCLAWAPAEGGKSLLASVALDGALVLYGGNGPYSRPAMEVKDAHKPDTWTGGIAFSGDGRLLATRGQDQTVKLWDTRKMKMPIASRADFSMPRHPETALVFSSNNTSLLTGDAEGNLHVLSAATLSTSEIHAISSSPIISLVHHTTINQLLLGTAGGSVHILFSPAKSTKGAKSILAAPLRKRHIDDDPSLTTDATAISGDAIVVPSQQPAKRKANDKFKPEMPAPTPWGKSQPDQEHIRKSIALSSMRDEDPREALLKYADKAEKDPMFTGVWKKNQPKTIYMEAQEEEEEEQPDKKKRRW
ncbi:WD40-repeat-containing domain protein [Sphaerosporella brunnea]|uniref:WD40-repeat-containing domain protein n=1 Tax=Sphaerosporella brunnea TaxID=1250544 RepID=A0A5J5ERP9_9PEZI|nr:WD40-repeat-containing domain protein [Sphaerosporella brunnea]